MQSALTEYENSFRNLLDSIVHEQSEKSRLEKESRDSEHVDLVSRLESERKRDIDAAMNRIRDELASDFATYKATSRKASSVSNKAREETEKCKRELNQLKILLTDATRDVHEQTAQRKRANEERRALEDEKDILKAEIIKLQSKIRSIESSFKTFQDEIETNGIRTKEDENEDEHLKARELLVQHASKLFSRVPERCLPLKLNRSISSSSNTLHKILNEDPIMVLQGLCRAERSENIRSNEETETIRRAQEAVSLLIDEKVMEPRRLFLKMHRLEAKFERKSRRRVRGEAAVNVISSSTYSAALSDNNSKKEENETDLRVQEKMMLLRKYISTQRASDLGRLAELEGTVRTIHDVTKRQDMNSNDISQELYKMKTRMLEMNRNMNEMCDRLDRELAHVGDMAVLRCGTCGKSTTSANAKNWKVLEKPSIATTTKIEKKGEEEEKKIDEVEDRLKTKTRVFVGRRAKLKFQHRRLFTKTASSSPGRRTRRMGFRGGKVLRPQTADL